MKRFIVEISLITSLGALALLGGCTNTDIAHLESYGSDGRITCYSGGRIFFDDFSSGKIANATNSDGYEFMSKTTGRLMQVSGECVVDYGSKVPAGWTATLPGMVTTNPVTFVTVPKD